MKAPVLHSEESRRIGVLDQCFSHGDGFVGVDYLHALGNARDALLYYELFFPKLEILSGSVLLAAMLGQDGRKRFLEAVEQMGRVRAEQSFNRIDVPYVFSGAGPQLTDSQDEVLANSIGVAWKRRLAGEFPKKKFHVRIESPEETGEVVGVCFWEQRSTV